MTIAAIIVAGGSGQRAGGGIPKQYRELVGQPVLRRTVTPFLEHPRIDQIVVVIAQDHQSLANEALGPDKSRVLMAFGGASRSASVQAGLAALADTRPQQVLIHDAARPFVSVDLIDRVIAGLSKYPGIIPALPVVDALAQTAGSRLAAPVNRTGMVAAQTPQGFDVETLVSAYQALGPDADLPDDASVLRAHGQDVGWVDGDDMNFKLTRPDDFAKAERMLTSASPVFLSGQGYDVHRLKEAESMWLCGVELKEGLGLVGHSDADAGLHALTDAILGAAGEGDIGQHFPPSDDRWKGASSDKFLRHAIHLLGQAGGALVHVDVTLICERPKIGPYRDAMRARIAELCDLPLARVNIKATTTEKLGFTGRREGLAAQAIATARFDG
ncbi:bifunctional 2-C-methyl-D-erythritol 4-phosphate cytidylyltransferase/2-C-methyl-D-erythritol 2,4-cyclodiphosphate synthase [Maricaulis sp. D1M11]|uniref:bifunctional 2-C-methyl-D-erythritol 4-phosphate cytidylyltransferase/2-C-methyl-D-erythritol 2,4-cyclodiphosphate synthase n=1 Tax=Maricaulis sp. D1M11 TaxID=3076117 RepID=UPI0039B41EBC